MTDTKTPKIKPAPAAVLDSSIAEWSRARQLADSVGPMPVSFTTPIRALLIDQRACRALRPASQFLVTRLMRSPTIKAVVYYSALTFHGDRLNNAAYLTSAELLRTFAPDETAALLALIFAASRTAKLGKLLDCPEWQSLLETATLRGEIGGHVGYAVPGLGAAQGMLVGAMPFLARGVFLALDREGAVLYARHLQAKKLPYDLDFELSRWQTTHLHVGANMLQMLGLGVPAAHAFVTGLNRSKEPDSATDQLAYEFFVLDDWINVLLETGAEPSHMHLGRYYPAQRDAHKLLYEVDRIRREGSKHLWLQRSRRDINPHDTPQLFQEFLQELQQSKALMTFYEEHLPKELFDSLSQEELQELSSVEKRDPEEI